MDFDLSADQLELRAGAASLLDGMATASQVRKTADTDEHVDRALWSAMAEQGWLAVAVPEARGGLGLGMVETAVLAEEIGRHVAPVPVHGAVTVAGALCRALESGLDGELSGRDLQSWVTRLAAGDAVGALAWSSESGAVRSEQRGDGWVLSGVTDPVVYAPIAELVVSCATGDGLGLFVWAPSARPDPVPAMDRTRSLAPLVVDGEPALRLGDTHAVEAVIDAATVVLCAEMLGAADEVLARTVQYAKDRMQFGRPIGSFQAVQTHVVTVAQQAALVDVAVQSALSREGAFEIAAAKLLAGRAALSASRAAHQVHGAVGVTRQHPLGIETRRLWAWRSEWGGERFWAARLGGAAAAAGPDRLYPAITAGSAELLV